MGCLKCLFFFSAFSVIVLATIMYHPMHPDLHDRGIMRFVLGMSNIMTYVAQGGELFGYNRYVTARVLNIYMAESAAEPLEEGIQERRDTFNGVSVHIFEPKEKSSKLTPGLIYVHGGGYHMGSSDEFRMLLDVLAKRLQTVVVAINYRLAPEYHYPTQHNDVMAVVNHVGENAEKLGIDPKHIGIAADSVGANLAAAVTLKLRDTSSPFKFRYQILLYPVLQGLVFDLPSHLMNDWHTFHATTSQAMADYITMYIGADLSLSKYLHVGNHTTPEIWKEFGHLVDPHQLPKELIPEDYNVDNFGANRLEPKDHGISKEAMQILTDPYAFPFMAKSLKKLPPAFVLTCNLDTVRDEGIFYVQRLRKYGVKVEHYEENHGLHPSIVLCKGPLAVQVAHDALDAITAFYQKQ